MKGPPLLVVVAACGLFSVGFGLSYAFITQGILGGLTDDE
jgi:hypothetical protein